MDALWMTCVCYAHAMTVTTVTGRYRRMDDSFNLARHVARFVSLLIRSPEAVDQQKLELRTLVLLTREGTVRLTTRRGQVMANGLMVPEVLAGVRDLADRMDGHGIAEIEIRQNMVPADLLAVGRIIAQPPEADQRPVHERLRAVEAPTVRVVLVEPAPTDVVPAAAAAPEPLPGTAERLPFILALGARGGDGRPLGPLFEEVAFAVEQAIREGRTADAIRAFHRIVQREPQAANAEARRHFVLVVRRLTKPVILAPIAASLRDHPDLADATIAVLIRCDTDGVDAVVDQMLRAASATDREVFVHALERLPSCDAALVAMLSDARPHVARAAAELIGARRPPDGDRALAELLAGADPRVRRAAVRALRAYDTSFSIDAIARALDDPVVEVRLEAAAALAARRAARADELVGRAVESETDLEVQVGLINALGRIGTADAVARLARMAEAGSGLFGARRETAIRVAAVRALARARTPGALSLLQSLAADREREVREVAVRAIAR